MKHVAGFPNSAGVRITTVALSRVQSRRSGVTAIEQIRTRAVSIVTSISDRLLSAHGPLSRPEHPKLWRQRLPEFEYKQARVERGARSCVRNATMQIVPLQKANICHPEVWKASSARMRPARCLRPVRIWA